jgi:hypothetical protein
MSTVLKEETLSPLMLIIMAIHLQAIRSMSIRLENRMVPTTWTWITEWEAGPYIIVTNYTGTIRQANLRHTIEL